MNEYYLELLVCSSLFDIIHLFTGFQVGWRRERVGVLRTQKNKIHLVYNTEEKINDMNLDGCITSVYRDYM